MTILRRTLNVLKNKKGYALVAVLCALLVFTVLGSNALAAASATVGATAKKQDDAQAYALASSALVVVSDMMERGDFSKFIRENVLTQPNSEINTTATFTLPGTTQVAEVQVHFITNEVKTISLPGKGNWNTGPITIRLTTNFHESEYSFFADFQHLFNDTNPAESVWKLQSYRNDRIVPIVTTP